MKRTIIAFGLLWIIIWCVFGLFLSIQAVPYLEKVQTMAQEGNLEACWGSYSVWKANTNTHAHSLCLSFIAILVGFIIPETGLSDKSQKILGILLITGVVLASIFQLLWVLPVMILGDVLVIVAVLMSFVGMIK